jgi:hypothetical protein
MKQSNITYKQTYHFAGTSKMDEENSPSISHDPVINTKINENPYRSNVEIEKDEVVLRPDLSALHKAGGNKHTQGGTEVFLPEGSFIFSDDKSLSLTNNDFKRFELKEGGTKKKLNTPAKVVEKNVDLKHYNAMMAIINDPTKDKVAKDTAAAMIEKYVGILGNVAYIQEKKKDLPQGVPDFAMGTAPVYEDGLKEEIDENKQYMKYGGSINNPYKMQAGGNFNPILGHSKIPSRKQDRFIGKRPPYPESWTNYFDKTQNEQYNAPDWIDPNTFYNTPGVIDYMKTLNDQKGVDNDLNKPDDGWWGWRHQAALDKFFPNGQSVPNRTNYIQPREITLPTPDTGHKTINNPYKIAPGEVTGDTENGIPVNWEFTPWQKQSQLYNGLKWASVDREMPMRSRYNATYADPALLNPEQTIADMKSGANRQIDSADLLSPILANSQKAASYGDFLDRVPGVRSQYDSANVGIQNQFRQYNNQVKNNETMVNMNADQQYWKDSAVGRQNFKNMRGYLADQWMNNRMQDVQDNQSLAYQMLTLGPKPAYGFDFKSGNFYRNDKNILDVQSNNNYREDLVELAQTLKNAGMSDALIGNIVKSKAFQMSQPTPRIFKRGGTNPYKK